MTKPRKRAPTTEALAIGNRIRELREILELDTQQRLAEVLSDPKYGWPDTVSRGAVGNWEQGQGIKFENIQRIAVVTECSLEWLATGRGVPYPVRGIDHDISMLPREDQEDLIPDIKAMVNRRLEKYRNH